MSRSSSSRFELSRLRLLLWIALPLALVWAMRGGTIRQVIDGLRELTAGGVGGLGGGGVRGGGAQRRARQSDRYDRHLRLPGHRVGDRRAPRPSTCWVQPVAEHRVPRAGRPADGLLGSCLAWSPPGPP